MNAPASLIQSSPSTEHYLAMTAGIRKWWLTLPDYGGSRQVKKVKRLIRKKKKLS